MLHVRPILSSRLVLKRQANSIEIYCFTSGQIYHPSWLLHVRPMSSSKLVTSGQFYHRGCFFKAKPISSDFIFSCQAIRSSNRSNNTNRTTVHHKSSNSTAATMTCAIQPLYNERYDNKRQTTSHITTTVNSLGRTNNIQTTKQITTST